MNVRVIVGLCRRCCAVLMGPSKYKHRGVVNLLLRYRSVQLLGQRATGMERTRPE